MLKWHKLEINYAIVLISSKFSNFYPLINNLTSVYFKLPSWTDGNLRQWNAKHPISIDESSRLLISWNLYLLHVSFSWTFCAFTLTLLQLIIFAEVELSRVEMWNRFGIILFLTYPTLSLFSVPHGAYHLFLRSFVWRLDKLQTYLFIQTYPLPPVCSFSFTSLSSFCFCHLSLLHYVDVYKIASDWLLHKNFEKNPFKNLR